MKKTTLVLLLLLCSLTSFVVLSFAGQRVSAASNYDIQSVDHQVEVLYSGHLRISDRIRITGDLTDGFRIGFPYKYTPHVLTSVAYDSTGSLPLIPDVQLDGQTGFYAVEVSFPEEAPSVFTVVFILSNNLVNQTSTGFNVDFPVYPSCAKDVPICNVSIVLPGIPTNVTVAKEDGIVNSTNFVKSDLPAFSSSPAILSFDLPATQIQLIDIETLETEIRTGHAGEVSVSDTYRVISKSPTRIDSLELPVPINASNIAVRDQLGRPLGSTEVFNETSGIAVVNATLIIPLETSHSNSLTVEYNLPRLEPEQTTRFTLLIDLFPPMNYYFDKAIDTIIPPEGAKFSLPQTTPTESSYVITRGTFQEIVSVKTEHISYFGEPIRLENVMVVVYEYNPLWIAFRPTLLMSALAAVGFLVLFLRTRSKAKAPRRISAPKSAAGLSPDRIKVLIDSYEEKSRITSELQSLAIKARKGKIPRRRYKVQRRTLEVRLRALNENIEELKETLRGAGGNFAALVKQLDRAEDEIEELDTKIESAKARYNRGELSLESYRTLLADYNKRKEKAETKINGILLRIREEIQ